MGKKCTVCGENKPSSEFHKRSSSKDGLNSYCKVCAIKRVRQWYKTTGHKHRRRWTVSKYGLDMPTYDGMIKAQKGLCAICKKPMVPLPAVDHCHRDGKVRGLLCRSCNGGLGLFKDDISSLIRAIQYLSNSLPDIDWLPDEEIA